VFINQHLRVQNCQLILTEPAPNDPTLYPSDHFGIAAELEIVKRSHFQDSTSALYTTNFGLS
jgi:hypothetical protein